MMGKVKAKLLRLAKVGCAGKISLLQVPGGFQVIEKNLMGKHFETVPRFDKSLDIFYQKLGMAAWRGSKVEPVVNVL